jgi:hypothetical protein
MSKLTIPQQLLKRIAEKSSYNRNYYKLPFTIDGSDVVFGKSDDDCGTDWYSVSETNDLTYIGSSDIRFNHDAIDVDIQITSEFPS